MSPRTTSAAAAIAGVTGPVAAGKSTFARALEKLGARRIDVDALGHEALGRPEVAAAVRREFGAAVISPDGSIDRRALAKVAFSGASPRRRLEAIVHPVVRRRIDEEVRRASKAGVGVIVLDCALLFESGLDEQCNVTVVVDAPQAQRHERARAAHGWDADEVRRREAAQLTAAEKRSRADVVIVNDSEPARLEREARSFLATWAARDAAPAVSRRTTR